MMGNVFRLSIGKKILFGFTILILIYIGMTLYGYFQMQHLRDHSRQIVPLGSQINDLQDIGISIESLETTVDKFFTVAYSEHLEKVNNDIDDLNRVIWSIENQTDNNTRVRFEELEGTFREIRGNIKYLEDLRLNSTNHREINDKRVLVYELIRKGKQKHRELLLEITGKLNDNALYQESVIVSLNSHFLNMGIAILAAGTVISIIISRSISRPVEKLKAVTAEIAHGNMNIKTGIRSNDEMGQLATAFDKMTEELQRTTISKQTLQIMFNSMPYGIILIGMDKKIISANQAALDMMDYKSEEMIAGLKCNKILCPAEDDKCLIIDFKQKVDKSEKILITKDLRHIPVLKTVVPIKLGDREILLEAFLDISESKRIEEIRIENERLACASRAKSDFLANMSHELRTPLNAIIGFSELLKQMAPEKLTEKQAHYVDNVLASSNHLLGLINDILDLSKVEAGKIELVMEKISVPAVIDEALILIKEKAAKHNVRLKMESDSQLEFIVADKKRFKQILFNLLANAVKFSKPEGGTITIHTEKAGGMARISVKDTGIGIKEEDMGKLFKEFEQLDSGISRRYGGTGLGLAITRKLVEIHGGMLTVESKYGVGSTFTFTVQIEGKKNGGT